MRRWLVILLFVLGGAVEVSAQLNKPYFYIRGRDFIVDGHYKEAIASLNILLRAEPTEYEGYFLRGVAKYNLDDLQGALQDFTMAIEYNPVYTLAFQYRGITRSRLGLYNEALSDFARALEMRPNFGGAYYSRAVTYFLNQQFERAIKDYNNFLRIQPLDPAAHVNRGTAKLYLKDTIGAMSDYNRAIRINPYYEDSYLRRGLVSLVKGDTKSGIYDMDKAIALDSTMSIAYFYKAMGYNTLGDIQLALDNFDNSVHYDPTNSVAVFNRALLRSQVGDYNRAIDDYNIVATQNPNNVLVYYNRAAVYGQLGYIDNAISDYSRAIELYPDFANAYLYRAQLKALKRDKRGYYDDTAKANKLLAEYIKGVNRKDFDTYADTSKRFSAIMSFDNDFDKDNLKRINASAAAQLTPRQMFRFVINPVVDTTIVAYDPRQYGNARLDKFIRESGVSGLEIVNQEPKIEGWRMMEIDSMYSGGQMPTEVFANGIAQTMMRQYASAMNLFGYVISSEPTNPFAYINRAVTDVEMIEFMSSLKGDYQNMASDADPASRLKTSASHGSSDFSRAISDLKQAAALMPELPYIYYNLGYIYAKQGDFPASIEAYGRAIELFPYFADAYYNRGLVQLMVDEPQKGCLDLSRAGELGVDAAYGVVSKFCVKK